MTEAQWLGEVESEPLPDVVRDEMLDELSGKASTRKLRLFACACVRHIWPLLRDKRSRKAVETAERYADGAATDRELEKAGNAAQRAVHALRGDAVANNAAWAAAWATHPAPTSSEAVSVAGQTAMQVVSAVETVISDHWVPEAIAQCHSLRDLFGNPFRPVAVDPAWLTPTVVQLAEVAYQERQLPSGQLDPARLAVLADALEEAGCTDQDILGHLRQQGAVHVRGCFVIDLVLSQS